MPHDKPSPLCGECNCFKLPRNGCGSVGECSLRGHRHRLAVSDPCFRPRPKKEPKIPNPVKGLNMMVFPIKKEPSDDNS